MKLGYKSAICSKLYISSKVQKGRVTALSSTEERTSVPNILSWVELDSSKQLYMPDKYILQEECVAEDLTESKLTLVKIEFF